jgi:hypothetical protein
MWVIPRIKKGPHTAGIGVRNEMSLDGYIFSDILVIRHPPRIVNSGNSGIKRNFSSAYAQRSRNAGSLNRRY